MPATSRRCPARGLHTRPRLPRRASRQRHDPRPAFRADLRYRLGVARMSPAYQQRGNAMTTGAPATGARPARQSIGWPACILNDGSPPAPMPPIVRQGWGGALLKDFYTRPAPAGGRPAVKAVWESVSIKRSYIEIWSGGALGTLRNAALKADMQGDDPAFRELEKQYWDGFGAAMERRHTLNFVCGFCVGIVWVIQGVSGCGNGENRQRATLLLMLQTLIKTLVFTGVPGGS